MITIFLVGPKHCGKTSVGKALTARCSAGFIDLDELITERTGKSPRDWNIQGPEAFRQVEAAALASLLGAKTGSESSAAPAQMAAGTQTDSPLIIATGGGIIDNPPACALLKQSETAAAVYLSVSAESAWRRISEKGALPPFLETGNPRETHLALHERRAAAYRQFARFTVEAEGKSPIEIAQEIARCLFDTQD